MAPRVGDGNPMYAVIEFTFSDEDTDSEFIVMRSGKRFIIRLFADNFSESPSLKDRDLFFLRVADEFELEGLTVDDFYDWEPNEDDAEWTRHGLPLPHDLCSSWPCFNPSEIEICSERPSDALSTAPRKVRLPDGTTVFFLKRPMDRHSAKQEIQNYKKIKDAGLEDDLRISRLHGLVRSEDGLVFGLLLTYIDCGNQTLTCAVRPDSPLILRRKWAEQVRSTVERLHEAGVLWGDAKMDNVLVDENDDAWVVDFGGGYTKG
ncbi:uncharacterized protein DNG_05179 [Cephalotrichum gorgonifer]|uniref:Protein kinase domain-containing protein n=1 Tax=Cephalotrichum gorgonifer TaxID=2041049 RepID=A0AAE8SVA2_9PEZI|nr:uncharacterized protein DNG_05179 [Cephalotrichum gorgonifer]